MRAGIGGPRLQALTAMQPHVPPELARAFALAAEGRGGEAVRIIQALAGKGDPEALFTLADMHWRGELVAEDLPHGRALFGQAAETGHPLAARAFTNLLATGIAGTRDWPAAMARLRDEARVDARRAAMLALIEAMVLTPTGFAATPPRGQAIAERPEIIVFRNLFTAEECDFLLALAEPSYEAATVVSASGADVRDAVRTSDGATIHWLIEDPATHALNRRLAAASGTLYEQGEPLLILRYRPGQQYRRHFDAIPGAANQRFKTALVYLNADYEGGETEFGRIGLMFRGQKGDAIVFRNTIEDSRADPLAEHAGMPVIGGTKYLASRWIRERRHLPKV